VGAYEPFWSSDSQSIGFFAGGKLKKVALSGGPVQVLVDAPNSGEGTWSRDGSSFSRGLETKSIALVSPGAL
jgi:hypothetical protein